MVEINNGQGGYSATREPDYAAVSNWVQHLLVIQKSARDLNPCPQSQNITSQ